MTKCPVAAVDGTPGPKKLSHHKGTNLLYILLCQNVSKQAWGTLRWLMLIVRNEKLDSVWIATFGGGLQNGLCLFESIFISRHPVAKFWGDRNVQAKFSPYFVSDDKKFGKCSCAACNFKIFKTQNFHQVPLNRGKEFSSLALPYFVPVPIRVYWTTVFNSNYWTGLES